MSKRVVAGAVAGVLGFGGVITYAVVDMHNWTKACEDQGGQVEERYERTDMVPQYTYDSKGNVNGLYFIPQDVYSYHCWVGDQEINPRP